MRRSGPIIRVAVVAATLSAALVTGGAAPGVLAAGCRNWTGEQPPAVGTFTALHGVAFVSACSAWAVGTSSVGTVVEQWTGRGWIVIASPNPPGSSGAAFDAVAATAASNAWAVGSYTEGGAIQSLIERWRGSSWSIQTSKDPGTTLNVLYGVAAVSASDAWAVGTYSSGGHSRGLVEHWNGAGWKLVATPEPAVPTNDVSLDGVVAISATNAWAVGSISNGTTPRTLILHWDGKAWKVQRSRDPSDIDNALTAVAATSATSAWAVGYDYNATAGQQQTLVERWNGTAWKVQKSRNTPDRYNTLLGVAATSAGSVWAVGTREAAGAAHYQTLIERWDGTAWSIVPSPDPGGGRENDLNAVAAASASNVWAVGAFDTGTTAIRSLVSGAAAGNVLLSNEWRNVRFWLPRGSMSDVRYGYRPLARDRCVRFTTESATTEEF